MDRKKLGLIGAVLAPAVCGAIFAFGVFMLWLGVFVLRIGPIEPRLQLAGASLLVMGAFGYAAFMATMELWEKVSA